jgi:hypothetical protein
VLAVLTVTSAKRDEEQEWKLCCSPWKYAEALSHMAVRGENSLTSPFWPFWAIVLFRFPVPTVPKPLLRE